MPAPNRQAGRNGEKEQSPRLATTRGQKKVARQHQWDLEETFRGTLSRSGTQKYRQSSHLGRHCEGSSANRSIQNKSLD